MTKRRRIERKPIDAKGVADVMAMFLILTTILHLFVGATADDQTLRLPLMAFGCLFLVSALLVRTGRNGVMTAIIFAGLGLALGGGRYINQGGPWMLPIMFAIDAVVLGLGVLWLRKTRGIG
jgi:hypothetical protein